jgi:hypothetical protein
MEGALCSLQKRLNCIAPKNAKHFAAEDMHYVVRGVDDTVSDQETQALITSFLRDQETPILISVAIIVNRTSLFRTVRSYYSIRLGLC